MLETLTLESFTPLVGDAFQIAPPGVPSFALTLDSATTLASDRTRAEASRRTREPFRLIFRGPALPLLPQRIYALEHAQFGRMEIFLVPIGPGEYEAVFT